MGFESKFVSVQLDASKIGLLSGDFRSANNQMRSLLQEDPTFGNLPDDLRDWFLREPRPPSFGDPPPSFGGVNFTWHHSEITGRLELVDRAFLPRQLNHTGGNSLWGNGFANKGN